MSGIGDTEKTAPVAQEKKYTVAELTEGGVIDVEKAKAAGYVPYAETADDIVISINDEAKEYVDVHYDDIVANAKIAIKEMIGRDVEITFIGTPFPYMAAEISYKTVDFPVIYDSTGVGLADNLQFLGGGYKEIDEKTVKRLTVASLYEYAFEDEINEMRNYFKDKFPQYIPIKAGSDEEHIRGESKSFISVEVDYPDGDAQNEYRETVINKIYNTYYENVEVTKEQLRAIFQEQTYYYISVRYSGYLIDQETIPKKEMNKEIMKEIRNYNYYWCNNVLKQTPVTIGSNLRKKQSIKSMIEVAEML